MKQKLFGIGLIVILSLPLWISHTWLHYRKAEIRREVQQRIEEECEQGELVLLSFTRNEAGSLLRWEHDHEFCYQGEMYDVVEKTTRGDSVFYRCWWDKKETAVNKKLDRLAGNTYGKDPQHHHAQMRLLSFLQWPYCEFIDSRNQEPPAGERLPGRDHADYYHSVQLAPPDPPPRLS